MAEIEKNPILQEFFARSLHGRAREDADLADECAAAARSIFPLWRECLSESDDYANALADEPVDAAVKAMVTDFGALEPNFMQWWILRGRQLFAAQLYTPHVSHVPSERLSAQEIYPVLHIKVPLQLSRKDVNKQLTELLDIELDKAKLAADQIPPKRQLYQDQRLRRASIEMMLRAWRARKHTTDEWWQTGEQLGLNDEFVCQPDDDAETVKRKQRLMSLTTQRLHRTAASLIHFAARGDFPRVK
jgi:hypothetical protein